MRNNDKTIVVIGDWFVDENWLVTKHHSYSSSHTGSAHYLSRHEINKPMTRLCGAPSVLQALDSLHIPEYSIIGFGVWNKSDDDTWKCVLCEKPIDEKNKRLTPFTLKGLKEILEGNKCPYAEKECSGRSAEMVNLAMDDNASTNRIIRVFEGHGAGEPQLLYRYDWVLPVKNLNLKKLESSLKDRNIIAVVIQDHDKGVIKDSVIDKLIEITRTQKSGSDVKWYIHSKVDNPTWLNKFDNIEIRLRCLHYELAKYKSGPRQWQCGSELGRSSLELLGELSGSETYKGMEKIGGVGPKVERVAILLDENKVIAKDGDFCINLYESPGPRQLINIGRTTIFFSCLILKDIQNNFETGNFREHCDCALRSAYEWSVEASKAWKSNDPNFYPAIKKVLKSESIDNKVPSTLYSEIWRSWTESSEKLGIVKGDKFQVWRGEGAIKGYICPGGEKRDKINKLLRGISQFNDQKEPLVRPFNCLLISRPGWGKSYLAESLASHFGMSYMGFSLAQMATTQDLIDCFDSICSHQNREKNKNKLLIFMDEVNSEIEGNLAMGLLLGPIWDGRFLRNGKLYLLSPAVWIFASTAPVESLTGKGTKGSDFISRLNGPIIRLDSLEKANDADKYGESAKKVVSNPDSRKDRSKAYGVMTKKTPPHIKTEQVYLGVSLLNRFWGPISRIEKKVLIMFHNLVPINGVRSLEFFALKFRDIKGGIIDRSNIPDFEEIPELKRHIILPPGWGEDTDTDKKFISIETLIPT